MYFETALKKGELGENLVCRFLEKKGWVVYRPFTKNKAHYFDMLCTLNKEKVIAIDVKTKARLNKWNAQGINISHYNQYLKFVEETKVNFYLVFVDDKTGLVHIADITKLKDPVFTNKEIIAWNVEQMKYLFTITEEDVSNLSKLDQRKYKFNPSNHEQRK